MEWVFDFEKIGGEREAAVEAFRKNLVEHTVDLMPEVCGKSEAVSVIGDSLYGCVNGVINRPHPPIEASITLGSGKSLVLIGANGAGKSTVFDAIMEIRNAYVSTQEDRGAVVYGDPVHGRDALRISRLNQEETLGAIKNLKAADVLDIAVEKFQSEFSVDWMDMDKYEDNLINEAARHRIDVMRSQIVQLFGMEEFLERQVGELSGGERTKLSLFSVLLSEPDVLLLDEPTNHLDMESIAKLTGLFDAYTRAGISVVSVSHVGWFLEAAGKNGVIEVMATDDSRKVVQSSASLKNYLKDRSRSEYHVIDGSVKWASGANVKTGILISAKQEKVTIPQSPLKDFYPDSILGGSVVVLSGNNGTGKTRLMEALAQTKKNKIFERGKGVTVAYMPQFWPQEVAEGSLEDFYYWIKQSINLHSDFSTSKLIKEIKRVGFKSGAEQLGVEGNALLKRKLQSFSGGEQRLLWFLTVSLFPEVDMLMLDEPTNHMDKNLQKVITRAIHDFQGAVMLSTHDVTLLDEISKSVGTKVGSTIAPKNYVLEKKDGSTSISLSKKSPKEYMRDHLAAAQKEAKRFKPTM